MSRQARTMLEKLGFRDPDRGTERHDLGVSFAGSIASELGCIAADHFWPTQTAESACVEAAHSLRAPLSTVKPKPVQAQWYPEHRAEARAGKGTVGFLDGLLMAPIHAPAIFGNGAWAPAESNPWELYSTLATKPAHPSIEVVALVSVHQPVIVEVKGGRTPASDVVRQIQTYRTGRALGLREYWAFEDGLCKGKRHKTCGPAATLKEAPALLLYMYDMTVAEVELLRLHRILPIRLGERFDAFAAGVATAQTLSL